MFVAPLALVTALMSDETVAACASASGRTPQSYVTRAFELRHVTLRSGERTTVAADPCLAVNQSTRIMIYERLDATYRRVLDAFMLPAFAAV